jgi:glycosyltransferase involved in cell wall biosynthesis
MKTQVLKLLDDPEAARRMGDRARQILESGYEWRQLAPRIMAELESAL